MAIEAQEKDANEGAVIQQRETNPISHVLDSSVLKFRRMMERVWEILQKLEKSRRAVLAIKCQFLEPDIQKSIQEIEHYKTVFTLCLCIDVRYAALHC